ncbi:amidohydrolase family protein [Streptomyces sp. NPDC088747]|uniref:amidohydrolase family protein n=1 Tax=Streptomyces sp. NPDC088747 TaxID=3365886 RepID=UPI003813E670
MRIDVHAHYFPRSFADLLAANGRPDLRFIGQSDDLGERVRELDVAEIDIQILSAVGPSLVVPEPDAALRAARHLNDAYAATVDRHGGRFQAFGHVPLNHLEHAVSETDRCLGELGFAGIALPCSVDGVAIDDPRFEPFWANAARHRAVVYVHPVGSDSACHPGLDDWQLHTAFGSPTQIAAAPVRVVYSGLARRHPALRFVFAMGAGTLPFLWPRIEVNLRRGLTLSATKAVGAGYFAWIDDLGLDSDDPMGPLRNFWYDTAVQDIPAALLVAKETVGTDRLLLGSDAIFASAVKAVTYIENSAYLTEEEKTSILDTNALSLFDFAQTVR